MTLVLIIALVSVGLAIALAVRAAALPRLRTEESLGQIEAYGYRQPGAAEHSERKTSAARGDATRRASAGRTAERREAETQKLLLAAGAWNVAPASFVGYRMLAATASGLLIAWPLANVGVSLVVTAGAAAYAGFTGWRAPIVILKYARAAGSSGSRSSSRSSSTCWL